MFYINHYTEQIALVTPSGDYAMSELSDEGEPAYYQFCGVDGTYMEC